MKNIRLYTLVLLRKDDWVLLGYKKRGFGVNKWNEFGGKVEQSERILQAAQRELEEECGLTCADLIKMGVMDFEFRGTPTIMRVHLFVGEQFSGTVHESEEMRPQWFKMNEVPFKMMWPDDTYWWPYFMNNQNFKAYFLYENEETILSHHIDVVEKVY